MAPPAMAGAYRSARTNCLSEDTSIGGRGQLVVVKPGLLSASWMRTTA
jgi:hypothetical protein